MGLIFSLNVASKKILNVDVVILDFFEFNSSNNLIKIIILNKGIRRLINFNRGYACIKLNRGIYYLMSNVFQSNLK